MADPETIPPGLEVLRYVAFSAEAGGGNPAGLVLDAGGLDADQMRRVAAVVGYSETAFVTWGPSEDGGRLAVGVRYFSPLGEVPFCGHATVALCVALAERLGDEPARFELSTAAGSVSVEVSAGPGVRAATLTSVEPTVEEVGERALAEALRACGLRRGDLDERLGAALAYAGSLHLVLALASRRRLAELTYDFAALGALCAREGWLTVHVVVMSDPGLDHARDLFPAGGVVEDPATGAAAAAYGAFLRARGVIVAPATFTILQGEDLGRPGRLVVSVPGASGPVTVTGDAVALAG